MIVIFKFKIRPFSYHHLFENLWIQNCVNHKNDFVY